MMIRMKLFSVLAALSAIAVTAAAQTATSFEMRYFTPDSAADGRSVTRLAPFRFRSRRSGCHFIVYQVRYE